MGWVWRSDDGSDCNSSSAGDVGVFGGSNEDGGRCATRKVVSSQCRTEEVEPGKFMRKCEKTEQIFKDCVGRQLKCTEPDKAMLGSDLNKKRKYEQLHLDVGQSDFNLHTCSVCGFVYAAGNSIDEKIHKTFHKNYTHGIPFKGWCNERIIDMLELARVILVQDGDPPIQQKKVQEVVKIMETELGEGWILNHHCKVYLYVSSQRVAGCLVAEPITKAYRVVSTSSSEPCVVTTKTRKKKSTPLQFGSVCLQTEIIRKNVVKSPEEGTDNGVILQKDEPVPALCGIRAIWVTPSHRRKHIATNLLNAVLESFCPGLALNRTQIAFSDPTSPGKGLMTNYTRTGSFLVYLD